MGFAVLIMNIDYYRLVETSAAYYIAGIVLLALTILVGKNVGGHKSWLGFGGLGIQASEIMKIMFILFLAKYLSSDQIMDRKTRAFFISLGILLLPLGLIALQPDMGTSLVYFLIFLIMVYLGLPDDTYIRYFLLISLLSSSVLLGIAFYKYHLENGGLPIQMIDLFLLKAQLVPMLVYASSPRWP